MKRKTMINDRSEKLVTARCILLAFDPLGGYRRSLTPAQQLCETCSASTAAETAWASCPKA